MMEADQPAEQRCPNCRTVMHLIRNLPATKTERELRIYLCPRCARVTTATVDCAGGSTDSE
jgi:hypothetical protein